MEALAVTILEKLSSSAYKEFGIIWNLKEDIQKMKNTVSMIKSVLLDAETKAKNHQVSNWLEELKDVLYDADDLLDNFSIEDLRRKVIAGNKKVKQVRLFFSKSNNIAYGLKLGHQMKAIQKRLDDIAKIKNALQLTGRPMENPIVYREQRQTYSFVSKNEVIGREDEKKCIMSYLLHINATDNVSVIPIVGIGGLGKTALAQLVYNDYDVQRHFELRMWVYVSDEFDIKKIAQEIIGDEKNSLMEQVQQQLRNKIRGKKFLLVLDDLWNEDRELWLKLKSLFMEGGKGSMIIVTTRSQTVAKIAGTHPPLFLEGLDSQKSMKLFSRVAFGELKEQKDLELLAIGRDIVKKCAGLPLAIRTIGSLLFSRNLGRSDWLYFKDVEFSKIDQHKDKVFAMLKLSYDHLPSFLKKCFAYCSLFPKGFMFEKMTLIQLWVAEGFIQQSNDIRCVEDVGHEYFMSLLSMSFFQDVTIDDCGAVSTCKMHDLMHDLAQLIAGNEYAVVEGEEANIINRTRYLSSRTALQFGPPSPSSYKLRTFHLHPQMNSSNYLHQSYVLSFSRFKFLRVLTLRGLKIVVIPNSIEKMKHLRYIDLSLNTVLTDLPPGITSLQYLQTLKLSECSELERLPENLNKSLRHLELNGCVKLTCMPQGIGQLTNLQTLALFVSGNRSVNELGGLNNLRGRLEIKGLDFLRNNVAGIEKVLLEKQHLQQLELQWAYDEGFDEGFDRNFCTWLLSPQRDEQENRNWVEDEMILQALQSHHSLQKLVIDGFCGKRLPDWIGNLSSLLTLEIHNCNGLTSLPESICNLVSLQKLHICNCFSLEKRYGRAFGEDWPKISRIRKVEILPMRPLLFKYFS